jgi:hypothetical protein
MMQWNQITRWTMRAGIVCLGVSALVAPPALAARRILFMPPGGSAPRETKGGAARGDIACATTPSREAAQLILLTPRTASVGLTTSERPTFLAYVPPTSAKQALLNLKDAQGRSHYRQIIALPQQGGIVRIALPHSAPPLQLNQLYEWGVVLLCGGKLRADSPFAIATIQRTMLPEVLSRRLAKQPLIEQTAIYAENGVWYDMLSNLAELKQQKPQDQTAAQAWTRILTTAGLTKISSAPIVD